MSQAAPAYQREMRVEVIPVDPEVTRYRADPMDSDAYVLGDDGQFHEVSASAPFPLKIASGGAIRISLADEYLRWIVTGRGENGQIAASLLPTDARAAVTFESLPLEQFLLCNPRYMVRQPVEWEGHEQTVVGYSGNDVLLVDVADHVESRAPIDLLVDENLPLFRHRLLVLVDKG